jgi:hypothetical protein
MELLFKDEFLKLIKEGEKETTIRKGEIFPDSRDLILKALNSGKILQRKLKSVTYKEFRSLNLFDALADGFDDIDDLLVYLLEIYPDLKDDSVMTIFEFE